MKKINYKDLEYKYQLLSDLMDQVPDVIYFKDKKGRLIMVNQAHARGLGLKPEEVVGKTDFDIFPKERAAKMAKDDLYVMQTGKPIIDKIERATRADGVDNYVTTTKIPRYDKKGRVIGLVGITRDITHRMQLGRLREEKERVEKKLATLKELNQMKSEFVSVVSHELRTPLAIIKEALMLIFDEVTGPINTQQKEVLNKAKDNIWRLNNIINELLDLSRIETGRFKLQYFLVNLNGLLRDCSDYFQKLAEEKRISLDYSLPRNEVKLFIDSGRISQVFTNLINNAIKFTEQGGKIKVEVKVLENRVRVGVIDTGVGIAKRDLPRLFNKFVQVSKVPGAEKKGVGLGLAIVKEIVRKHGGEVWVESKLGVGSKFYFTLPRLYSVELLNQQVQERINDLLAKGLSIYLINLPIVNFSEFKKRVGIEPKRLFADLNSIINGAFKESSRLHQEQPQITLQDYRNGECSILFPEAKEEEVNRVDSLLQDRIRGYFRQNKVEDVFMVPKTEHPAANIRIKKIYIGSEIRRFKRIYYQADIDIFLPENKTEPGQIVDISQGGVCFISKRLLETDAQVGIKLELPADNRPLYIKGRVAWIKNIEQMSKREINKYKVGLEFIELENKNKKALAKFINSRAV